MHASDDDLLTVQDVAEIFQFRLRGSMNALGGDLQTAFQVSG